MELSISQLADLRIAIDKETARKAEVESQLEGVRNEYDHKFSETIRLRGEVDELVKQKEQLISDNDKLRDEKGLINSQFEEQSAKQYAELKEKERATNDAEAIVQARLVECEKREANIAGKDAELDKKIAENRRMTEEYKEMIAKNELSIAELKRERDNAIQAQERTAEEIRKLEAKREEAEKASAELEAKREEITKLIDKSVSATAEFIAREESAKKAEESAKRFAEVTKEFKDFVVNHVDMRKSPVGYEEIERFFKQAAKQEELAPVAEETTTEVAEAQTEAPSEAVNEPEAPTEELAVSEPTEVAETPKTPKKKKGA